MSLVTMKVNGEKVCHEVPARMHLGDYLRDEARLTGTHLGCEHGVCGACTVLVDGQPVRSCITFAVACDSKEVTTIEGYDNDPIMRRLRAAFTEHHALQCGFCTPGMLATARDIVLRLPHADEKRIRIELSGNLCRCTGYMGIVSAIRAVLNDLTTQPDAAIEALRSAAVTAPILPIIAVAAMPTFEAVADDSEPQVVHAAPQNTESDQAARGSKKRGQHLQGEFKVPFPPEDVWAFMVNLPAVASCLPGAKITEQEGNLVKGHIGVKFGPMQAAFAGEATLERDDAALSAILHGAGKDTISQSRAQGDIGYQLHADADGTRVQIDMEYSLQGPLAQFSRSGLVQDFVRRMITEFGRNVTRRMQNPLAEGEEQPVAALNPFMLFLGVLKDRFVALFKKRPR
jgi:carbon-monoxide dehydrogenase small subunit